MKRKLTLGVVCALLIAGCGDAEQARTAVPTDTSALQRAADDIHALGVPGVLAEAVVGEKHVTARSGVADLKSRAPLPIGAHFHIASNTKVFVAVVTLQLVGEGKLALDDTVDKWLPGLVTGSGNDGRRITVRNLLQHSSGLIDYTGDLPIRSAADWERERLRTYRPEELLAMSMKHEPSWLPAPGEQRFAYANINYVLAGMIIEKVTGHNWEQEVRDRIVSPLRLRDTSAPGTSPALPEPYVLSYAKFGLNEPWVDSCARSSAASYCRRRNWLKCSRRSTPGICRTRLRTPVTDWASSGVRSAAAAAIGAMSGTKRRERHAMVSRPTADAASWSTCQRI
jgi:D-alanyl-D-alanine carboxypeptidase